MANEIKKDIKDLYKTIKDPYLAMIYLGENKNPADYLDEALDTLDKTKLLALKEAYDIAIVEQKDKEKDKEVERLLKQINPSSLTPEMLAHPRVVKYLQKQQQFLNDLTTLLGS